MGLPLLLVRGGHGMALVEQLHPIPSGLHRLSGTPMMRSEWLHIFVSSFLSTVSQIAPLREMPVYLDQSTRAFPVVILASWLVSIMSGSFLCFLLP